MTVVPALSMYLVSILVSSQPHRELKYVAASSPANPSVSS
jgi:hypothetical protein